jgi:hypothetical protein
MLLVEMVALTQAAVAAVLHGISLLVAAEVLVL